MSVAARALDIDDGGPAEGRGILAEVQLAPTLSCKFLLLYPTTKSLTNRHPLDRKLEIDVLADTIAQENIAELLRSFLFQQLHPDMTSVAPNTLPPFNSRVSVHPSALAFFHAPSDLCGTEGISSERIRAVPSWQGGAGRYDCIYVETNAEAPGMLGLDVAQVNAFLSFTHDTILYPCALVSWFSRIGDKPDNNTHMWMLQADFEDDESTVRHCSVISINSIIRAAHLMPMFGSGFTRKALTPALSLTTIFRGWYANKYIDHHAFELAF